MRQNQFYPPVTAKYRISYKLLTHLPTPLQLPLVLCVAVLSMRAAIALLIKRTAVLAPPFQLSSMTTSYFYIKCVIPGVPTRRLRKKRLFVPLFRSWENAGIGMVDVKAAIHSWRWTSSRWMVVHRRKEELRYDGRGPLLEVRGRTPYKGSFAASSGAFDCANPAQHAVSARKRSLIKVSKTRQPIQIFQREVFKKQTLQVGLGGSWSQQKANKENTNLACILSCVLTYANPAFQSPCRLQDGHQFRKP